MTPLHMQTPQGCLRRQWDENGIAFTSRSVSQDAIKWEFRDRCIRGRPQYAQPRCAASQNLADFHELFWPQTSISLNLWQQKGQSAGHCKNKE